MTRSTRKFAAIVLGGVFALSAVTFTDFIRCAFAGEAPATAAEIGSTLLPVASEPAPRLTHRRGRAAGRSAQAAD